MSYARFNGKSWFKYDRGWRIPPSEVYVFGSRRALECCACRVLGKVYLSDERWYWDSFETNNRWEMLRHLKRHRKRGHAVPRAAVSRLLREIRQIGDIYHLKLERREQVNNTSTFGVVTITPMINEDYWEYRVVLNDNQAVLGFPKFDTIGIGFAIETNWNTNLPFVCSIDDIFNHIRHNKGDRSIPDWRVVEAITMIREAARDDEQGRFDEYRE